MEWNGMERKATQCNAMCVPTYLSYLFFLFFLFYLIYLIYPMYCNVL